jgi:hypothetical protein
MRPATDSCCGGIRASLSDLRRSPNDDREPGPIADRAGTAGIAPTPSAGRIANGAARRNVLVRRDLAVDFARIAGAPRRLDEFDDFARYALLALDGAG